MGTTTHENSVNLILSIYLSGSSALVTASLIFCIHFSVQFFLLPKHCEIIPIMTSSFCNWEMGVALVVQG